MTEWVWSWPTRLDTVVPDITSQFAKCSSYTMVATDGGKYRWVAKRLSVPGLTGGIAIRHDTSMADYAVVEAVVYVAFVVRQGTVVGLEAQGETITDAVFTQLVGKAAARLDAAMG
ncbi:hypothetical protein [Kribbella sp. VKM Ac-2566]|uniref:hypothetical protein n=1 Tax=Kribbella sp. VKM Ac-2566 TaxID=2512218 RepID=UPI001416F5F3|nr:hypothetical protein [Kribbella sp. VKM Ac-2566]